MPQATLSKYRQKRDFSTTPEPQGEKDTEPSGASSLRFVVQKHNASHLHYDLRLELDGVLKSWAVPKGPSLNPEQRRLAMMTEDHPLEYADFEGVIPKGNYGAGKMIVWDAGTYHVPGVFDRSQSEMLLRKGLERGNLKLYLNGEKLRGEFALLRTRQEEKSWLLIKKKDEFSSTADILLQDRSVLSGLRVDEVGSRASSREKSRGVRQQPEQSLPFDILAGEPAGNLSGETVAGSPDGPSSDTLARLLLGASARGPMPVEVKPMLATLTEEPFDLPGWVFELKWDGFRAIAETHPGSNPRLYSRHNQDYSKEFAPVFSSLKKVDFEAVFDGEIVVVDENGRGEFKLLQQYRRTGKGALVYFIFDLLYLEGYDLRSLPLLRRKEILRQSLPDLPNLRYSDHIEEDGVAFYKLALENDLEGIIAKSAASQYRAGVRSTEWLKIKTHHRQDAVIGGYTAPRGTRTNFGALLLGVYEGSDLVYIGHTGGGLDETDLKELKQRLDPLQRKDIPFTTRPKTNAPATWVDPQLVCEVRFAGWTKDGMMRQPVYMGLRSDKDPAQVRRELPISVERAVQRRYVPRRRGSKEIVEINGKTVELSNLSKVYWPEEAITKGDLINYYRQISATILPYLIDRPESLHRFPNGITGKHFYQKDVIDPGATSVPDWIQTVRLESDSSGEGAVDYLLCQDEATLAYMANLGCIEINPWNSRVGRLDNPDYLVIDLDPDERSFSEVIQVAWEVHAVLDAAQALNFIKTTGQTGLHIYVPLGARYTYEQARQFSHLVARLVHHRLPDLTSLERSPHKRRGKIYLDYLQNRYGQTLAAPYSVRPKPGAPVSTPLRWDELQPGISPLDFHMGNIFNRLNQVGDLFSPILGPGIDMAACLQGLKANNLA